MKVPALCLCLALLNLPSTSAAAQNQRLLMCGEALEPTASSVPAGLPSTRCSEVQSFGEALAIPSSPGSPRFDPTSILKGPDANSLRLRESLLSANSMGRVYLHVLIGDPVAPLEVLRTRIDDVRIQAISTGASQSKPVEQVNIQGGQYIWSVWSPPGPPSSSPTSSFCWDRNVQATC